MINQQKNIQKIFRGDKERRETEQMKKTKPNLLGQITTGTQLKSKEEQKKNQIC